MFNFFNNLQPGTKINLVAVLMLIFISAVNLALLNHGTNELIEVSSQERIQEEVNLFTIRFAENEQDILDAARFLSTRVNLAEAVEAGDTVKLQPLALSVVAPLELSDVDIIDREGNRLFTLVDTGDSDKDRLLDLSLLGIEVIDLLVDGNDLMLAASVPLRNTAGEIIGAVVVGRILNDEFLREMNFGRHEVHLGLHYQGHLVARDDVAENSISEPNLNGVALDESALNSVLQSGSVIIDDEIYSHAEAAHSIAYSPLRINDEIEGVLVTEIHMDEIPRFQAALRRNSLLAISLPGLVTMLVFAFIVRYYLTANLNKLQVAAEHMTGGDYSQRAEVTSRDRIGQLALSFNKMASAIQYRDRQLQELNATLEQRVAERTAELAESNRQLVEASRLKSEFLATMSHELRTPLNAIIGYSGLLLMGIGGQVDEEAGAKISSIQNSASHLLNLIKEILDIAKIEAGRMEIISAPVEIHSLVADWEQHVSVLAKEKELAFEQVIDPTLPPTIYGDSERLSQIAINLLSNAVKFTDRGKVLLEVKKEDDTWLLQVTDTGAGIPAEALEYIFDEFRQVDGSYRRSYGGTGLGLAIVRKLALAMGGKVRVTSKLGEGSTFTVQLPLKPVQELAGI